MDKEVIFNNTRWVLLERIQKYKKTGKGSFTITELLGDHWGDGFKPLYDLYNDNSRVIGQQTGKLLMSVSKSLKMSSKREDRRGLKNAVTRYFF